MPDEDATITDFIPDDGDGDAPDDDDGDAHGEDNGDVQGNDDGDALGDATSDRDAVEPAEPTATWHAEGACDACGAATKRRWRDGDALVCPGCKDW